MIIMRLISSLPVVICLLSLFCSRIDGLVTTDEILDDSVTSVLTDFDEDTEDENKKIEDALQEQQDIADDQADSGDVIEPPSEQEESTGQGDSSSSEDEVEVRWFLIQYFTSQKVLIDN